MKKLFLCSLFLLFASVAFAQSDKLLIGKWNFVSIAPSSEFLKDMNKEQLEQTEALMKDVAKKSYFRFAKNSQFFMVMDVGFGTPENNSTKYELLNKNTILHVFAAESKNGQPAIEETNMKIEKLTKTELVVVSMDTKTKGMKIVLKKGK